MNSMIRKMVFLFALLLAGDVLAGWPAGALVIANRGVKEDHISVKTLKDLYTGRTSYWEGGEHVVIAVLADKTDEALSQASGMDASQFRTFWQRLVFSGRGQEPKEAPDIATLVRVVAATRGAISLAPPDAPLQGVKVLNVE